MGVTGSPGCEKKDAYQDPVTLAPCKLEEGGVMSLPGHASKAFYPWSGQLALPPTALLPFVFIA